MKEIDSIQRDLLIEGLEDYVGLWQVARQIRSLMGEVATDLVRELAMKRLGPLLLEGYIEAGFPSANGRFDSWGVAGDSAIDRIDNESMKPGS